MLLPRIFQRVFEILLLGASVLGAQAADRSSPAIEASNIALPLFNEAQLVRVSGWIKERVPGCPPSAATAGALQFLEGLKAHQPEKFEQLLGAEFPLKEFESELLRDVAVALTEPAQAALREALAIRRVQVLLVQGNIIPAASAQDASRAIDRMKSVSPVYYRRLVDGRFDDADLLPLLKRGGRADEANVAGKNVVAKVLSASEIVSEFARHNQAGSALQRLRAYTIEATLTTVTGEKQNLVLSKMRPDRFRLMVKVGDHTQLILASSGHGFWQHMPNAKPVELSRAAMDTKVLLGEFINPMLTEDGYTFEKLEEGTCDGRKVYRISVRRADGSNYVSCIDTTEFREVGLENGGRLDVHYADFREMGGVTFAFREEIKDQQGRTAVLEVQRITVNPGLVQAYFEPAQPVDPNYFAVEQWLGKPGVAPAIVR